MTTQEKIEIMQAYVEGKQIQVTGSGCNDWLDCSDEPWWQWDRSDYRIKPEEKEPTYRPYENTEEMIADFKERFKVNVPDYAMPLIWVKSKSLGTIYLINGFNEESVKLSGSDCRFDILYRCDTYLDGSPFGKLVE